MDPISIGLAGVGLASSLLGANKAAKANKAAQQAIDSQIAENKAIYNNNVNRTFLDTNAAKGVLERIRRQYEKANQIADNKGVVTGASDEAVIAAKSANNEAMNDATSQLAEQATAYQDSQTNQYRQTSNQLAGVKIGLEKEKAQAGANLISNAGNLLGTAATLGTGSNGTGLTSEASSPKGSMSQILSNAKGGGGTAAAIASRTSGQISDLNAIAKSGADSILNKNFRV